MSSNAHVYHGIWPVIVNALIQRSWTENVLQEAVDLVSHAAQSLHKGELNSKTLLSEDTKQCRHNFKAMEKADYYVWGFKPFIGKEMLEKLRHMPSSLPSNLSDIRSIGNGKERFSEHIDETLTAGSTDEC